MNIVREPTAQEIAELGLREEEIVETGAGRDSPFGGCTITYLDGDIKVDSPTGDVTRQYKAWIASLPRKRRYVTDWKSQ